MSGGRPAPGARSELARRLATAFVALPLLALGMWWAPPLVGLGIVTVAVALGMWEFLALLSARDLPAFRASGALVLAAVFAQVAFPGWPGVPLWPAAAVVLLTALLLRSGDLARNVPGAAATLLGALYLGGLGGSIAALRVMEPVALGPWRILLLLAIVMTADTAAYFVGRAVGRRRLAPSISPGKTVEGALGGLLGGGLGALGVRWAGLDIPWAHAAALGVVAALLGIVGDLLESLLKRWAGVKDSGRMFPGHGGMLDRLDSLLFGAAVLYYYFSLSG